MKNETTEKLTKGKQKQARAILNRWYSINPSQIFSLPLEVICHVWVMEPYGTRKKAEIREVILKVANTFEKAAEFFEITPPGIPEEYEAFWLAHEKAKTPEQHEQLRKKTLEKHPDKPEYYGLLKEQ